MINENLKNKILQNAHSLSNFGLRDLIWDKECAIKLINSLMNEKVGILGGDVYKIENNNLIPMYDSWYCNPEKNELENEYFLRSKILAKEYIKKYPIDQKENIFFSIVFNEILD